MIKPKIELRGSTPTIEGTRTTVYHVMDYYLDGWHPTRIAARLRVGSPGIEAAIEYIEAHRAEVEADYKVILERCERGNSPEIRALMEARRPIVQAKMAEVLRKAREAREAREAQANGDGQNGSHR